MIVDDSRTVREAVKYTLGKENFHVIEAEDGQHGLDVLAEQQRLGKRQPRSSAISTCLEWTALLSSLR